MTVKPSHNPIDATAADWVARLDGEGVDADGRAAFERWLAEDSRHYGAYVRAQAAWTSLDRGIVLHADSLAAAPGRRGVPRRGLLLGGGMAAAAAAGGVAWLALGGPARRADYDTAAGEISQVSLPDGSTATLDTDSRINVVLTKAARKIQVVRGRVWFKVAKNHDWPFLVEAGAGTVRAVGTAFTVERVGAGAEVVVTEGVVDAWTAAGTAAAALRLEHGARARLTSDSAVRLAPLTPEDLSRAMAWRDGNISLEGETLAEASAAFNRYNRRKIVVADPELGRRKLVGYFRLQDPQGFAAAAATSLGAKVSDDGERIVLSIPEEKADRRR